MKNILIIGGGVGGTIVANVLARTLSRDEASVTVVDATGQHAYMPGWLYLPFNSAEGLQLTHAERSLLHHRVRLVVAAVDGLDLERREVTGYEMMAGGETRERTLPFDYLVLATGARLAPDDLPGLKESPEAWHEFYSLDGALRLRAALHNFQGGKIVVAIGGVPYRCPPAPLEFTFLLEDWLRDRGLRDQTEIEYLYPLPRVFPIESVAELVTPLLEERGVKYTTFFNVDSLDGEQHELRSMEGESADYDLLVMTPPHRGVSLVERAGLGDAQGWIHTDRATLEVKGQQGIFAIGDATDLPVSKSGSAAHFEAKVVATRLVAAVRGTVPDERHGTYDGEVMCFLETGRNQASQLVFNYEHPPQPPRPSLFYHMEKQLFNRAYWHIVPQGIV